MNSATINVDYLEFSHHIVPKVTMDTNTICQLHLYNVQTHISKQI